ncbi:ornithine decarboxylase-like [Gigantopelta aegis]|uniref:ornithine decarboxylase-like n=1 Tax=Gigantopelta aegis TaxID=1735272 RepID=UPI001B887725|nr:ornithine decarboxylase-like [Gigantopelta aegis]XP_041361186.1 ornithine decarboxylase-like [Gigantopelta aegis]
MKHDIGNGRIVDVLPDIKTKRKLIADVTASLKHSEDPFFLVDLGDIIIKYHTWKELFPRVHPFYAVKCNTDHTVIKLLADLGASFDCASKIEIKTILNLGVSPSRIIYANPCKQESFIRYAAKHNVNTMPFDNEAELCKIKQFFPEARLVLRILPPGNFKVQVRVGDKFGCDPKNAANLLTKAKELGLNVVGICFHIGSGVEKAEAYASAVEHAYYVFELGREMGFKFELLDVGGGFPGVENTTLTFREIADVLNTALDKYFPEGAGVKIIAEPGRYFVASAFTLAVNVIAKRMAPQDKPDCDDGQEMLASPNSEPGYMYYVNDGLFGSFGNLLFDHDTVQPRVVRDCVDETMFTSTIWGPTCCGVDLIVEDYRLPELHVGDWLFFENMGAYSVCLSTSFNGMPHPWCYLHCTEQSWYHLYSVQK